MNYTHILVPITQLLQVFAIDFVPFAVEFIAFAVVMCDISKKYRFRDNFVDIVIVPIFDTAVADFDIYRKGYILR